MNECCAPNCYNKPKNSEFTFHRFPRNEELKNKWLEALNKPPSYVNRNSVLCSAHFGPQCFAGLLSPKFLKSDSVPTIFNFNASQTENRCNTKEVTAKGIVSKDLDTDKSICNVQEPIEMEVDQSPDSSAKLNESADLKANKQSHSKRKQILIPRDALDKMKTTGSTDVIRNVTSDSSVTPQNSLNTSKALQTPSTSIASSKVIEVEGIAGNNDSESDCIVVEEVIMTEVNSDTINNHQSKPNYSYRNIKPKTEINIDVDTDNEVDQRKKSLFNESILKKRNHGRLIRKAQNCISKKVEIGEKVNIESLLKRRNACIQVHPISKDMSIQTNICDDDGNLPFKHRILNTTINVLQKRVSKLEQKLRTQSGTLWMNKKKLTMLREQNKELCKKLSDHSTNSIEKALKEVLREYFKDSSSTEDAVNKSKQLCLHANISFKRK